MLGHMAGQVVALEAGQVGLTDSGRRYRSSGSDSGNSSRQNVRQLLPSMHSVHKVSKECRCQIMHGWGFACCRASWHCAMQNLAKHT
jgi:hypothetical protein